MKNVNLTEFYRQVGKVFYGMAAADRVIKNEEKETVKKWVRTQWLDLEDSTDEFGEDLAFQIESSFDWFVENGADHKTILEDFAIFKETHSGLFTERVKKLIYATADGIASSFSGKNKSELIYLSKLEETLKKG